MLRHDHIPVHAEIETAAHIFQTLHEEIIGFSTREIRPSLEATKRHKVCLAGFLEAPETGGHGPTLHQVDLGEKSSFVSRAPRLAPTKRARTWGTILW